MRMMIWYVKEENCFGNHHLEVLIISFHYHVQTFESYKEPRFTIFSGRGLLNVFVFASLILALLALFAGYPIVIQFQRKSVNKSGSYGLGGTNGTGQIPLIHPQLLLIDSDTATSAHHWTSANGNPYHLVFSDEFNVDGRTFWPGDDPFWEGVDLWYGATEDLEWYSPQQINTTGGALHITLDNKPLNDLNFRSGMLQSWNKFCFSGGYIEFSAILPGSPEEVGYWPGLWMQGNLGRPGYLATTDGMWPYSYNSCDSGILPNQSSIASPFYQEEATFRNNGKRGLSWNPGMRTPSCTCSGEDHPGPNTNVGRGVPELDVLEAQINTAKGVGEASQSLQTGPFSNKHKWDQSAASFGNDDITQFNSFRGNVYQESVSAVTQIPTKAFQKTSKTFTTFGCEFEPDFSGSGKGKVTWYIDGKVSWSVTEAAIPAQKEIDIGQRLVPVEPMTIILNLGISKGFQSIQFDSLVFPAVFSVDYVRVYQPNSYTQDKISCDPADYPTSAYISKHMDVYSNPQLLLWPENFPKNRLKDGC